MLSKAGCRFYSTTRELIVNKLTRGPVIWARTGDVFHPYETKVGNETIKLRINNFPEEPLYTIMRGKEEMFHADSFLRNWRELGQAYSLKVKP